MPPFFPPPDPSLSPKADAAVPFEGVEKRLIVFYSPSRAANNGIPLPSSYDTKQWQSILDHAHCEICSVRHLGDTSVYLLSESTLTVWPNGFLMKTCGRTTPFLALRCLIEYYGLEKFTDSLDWLAYSRLDFLHPQYQVWPHQTFPQEEDFLSQYFPLVCPFELPAGSKTLYGLFHSTTARPENPFRTEEALLLGVNEQCVRTFTGYDHREEYENSDGSAPGSVIRPIMAALPEYELDEHWFSPCGYSANALTRTDDGDEEYFSTHISPEAVTSFASLEITKTSLKSAFPLDATGLAFFRMVPAFDAREVHITVINIEGERGEPPASMNAALDAVKVLEFNLAGSSEKNLVNRVGCKATILHYHFVQDRTPLMISLGLIAEKNSPPSETAINSNDDTSACSNDLSHMQSDCFDFPRLRKFTA